MFILIHRLTYVWTTDEYSSNLLQYSFNLIVNCNAMNVTFTYSKYSCKLFELFRTLYSRVSVAPDGRGRCISTGYGEADGRIRFQMPLSDSEAFFLFNDHRAVIELQNQSWAFRFPCTKNGMRSSVPSVVLLESYLIHETESWNNVHLTRLIVIFSLATSEGTCNTCRRSICEYRWSAWTLLRQDTSFPSFHVLTSNMKNTSAMEAKKYRCKKSSMLVGWQIWETCNNLETRSHDKMM